MTLQVDIQNACAEPVPAEDDIGRWIAAALESHRQGDSEISLRLVSMAEMTELNKTWRGKQGPTNVLSFPSNLPKDLQLPLLGDIVICSAVVQDEALQQGKDLTAHWAHMTVHGTLHLLGYDHIDEAQANVMEALETNILSTLNFPCPYGDELPKEHASA